MNKLTNWFYSTTLYYKLRYYFIRQKAPLSWIFWGEIMRREASSQGMYQISIALAGAPDCGICLNRGAPKDNSIEIRVYNSDEKLIDTVVIPLSYRDAGRVMAGFDKAGAISRKSITKTDKHL